MRVNEIVCCDFCGRDTSNKCRLCRKCLDGARRHEAGRIIKGYQELKGPRLGKGHK